MSFGFETFQAHRFGSGARNDYRLDSPLSTPDGLVAGVMLSAPAYVRDCQTVFAQCLLWKSPFLALQ